MMVQLTESFNEDVTDRKGLDPYVPILDRNDIFIPNLYTFVVI